MVSEHGTYQAHYRAVLEMLRNKQVINIQHWQMLVDLAYQKYQEDGENQVEFDNCMDQYSHLLKCYREYHPIENHPVDDD